MSNDKEIKKNPRKGDSEVQDGSKVKKEKTEENKDTDKVAGSE